MVQAHHPLNLIYAYVYKYIYILTYISITVDVIRRRFRQNVVTLKFSTNLRFLGAVYTLFAICNGFTMFRLPSLSTRKFIKIINIQNTSCDSAMI